MAAPLGAGGTSAERRSATLRWVAPNIWGGGAGGSRGATVYDAAGLPLCCPQCGYDRLEVDEVDVPQEVEVGWFACFVAGGGRRGRRGRGRRGGREDIL